MFAKSLAEKLRDRKIRVFSIDPGGMYIPTLGGIYLGKRNWAKSFFFSSPCSRPIGIAKALPPRIKGFG